MSEKNGTPEQPVTVTPEGVVLDPTPDKPSLMQRIVTPIKKHPKIATAVGLGALLVAGATVLGKEEISTEEEPKALTYDPTDWPAEEPQPLDTPVPADES